MDNNNWTEDLGKRGNLLYGVVGNVSILLEDIPKYVIQCEFDHKKITDIYTIARVCYKYGKIVILGPHDSKKTERVHALCHSSILKADQPIRHNRVHSTRLKPNETYKFYGSLRCDNNLAILDIHIILEIENVENCLGTLALTSKLCCQNYYQLYHSKRMEDSIDQWWDNVTTDKSKTK